MKTMTAILSLLFFVACSDEPRKEAPSPVADPTVALYARDGYCVKVEQVGDFQVQVWAQGLPHVAIDIRYATGHCEVMAVPQGAVIDVPQKAALAEVYPAWVLNFPGYPVLLPRNGGDTMQTTSGGTTYPAKIIVWNGGGNGSWEVR